MNEDDPILLVGDHMWHEIELPDPAAVGRRTAATTTAAGLHAMLGRHPWPVQAFGSHLFYGPGKARYDDHGLGVYEAAGFTGAEADRAAATVSTFVLGNALGTSATASPTRRLSRDGGNPEEAIQDALAKTNDVAMRFPRLRGRLTTPAADYNAAPEQTFEYGLRALLDGLESGLAGRSAPAAPDTR